MTPTEIPRTTTHREQLVKVINAAEALVNATADPRVPTYVRDASFRARYEAWGALNEYDAIIKAKTAGV